MRGFLPFLLTAALAAPALAQDQPKSLKTVRIHEPAPGSPNLYVIDEDGTVRIDWPPSKRSPRRKPIAPSCRWPN
jgi:hypothetical protein